MIAVLLATRNGGKYLEELLKSLMEQTYADFKIYAHDDDSSDDTIKILENWREKYPDKIQILVDEATGSAKNNFFYLLRNVNAPYYMFCDQDDVWHRDKIEKTWNKMAELEKTGKQKPLLAYSDLTIIDNAGKLIADRMSRYQTLDVRHPELSRLLVQNTIAGCTVMINDLLKQEALRCKDVNGIIMYDWWLGLTAARFGKIGYVDESLIKYRQHGANSVGAKDYHGITYRIRRLLTLRQVREDLRLTRMQARVFAETFAEPQDSLTYQYGRLEERGKFFRLWFYQKNNVVKSGFIRKLGLFIWG